MAQGTFEILPPVEVTRKAAEIGVAKTLRQPLPTFVLAMMGGVFIGIAFIFYTIVTTGNEDMGWGASRLMGAITFSLGLMLVVINGGEMFTSSVLSLVAKASGKISWSQMIKNWLIVFCGNFVGALALVAIMLMAKHYEFAGGKLGINYLTIAQHKLHHGFWQAVALGIMCNILVCLGVWMTYAGRTVADKLLAIMLPVAMFVAAGFEHCVANMFQIPMAIWSKSLAGADFWAASGKQASDFADLTWSAFLTANLLPVTIGNIIGGGVFVGLTYWFIYLKDEAED